MCSTSGCWPVARLLAPIFRPLACRPIPVRLLACRPVRLLAPILRPLASIGPAVVARLLAPILRPLACRPIPVRPLACRPVRLLAQILRPLACRPIQVRPLAPIGPAVVARPLAPIPRPLACRPILRPLAPILRPLSPGRWKFRGIFRLNLLSIKCGVMFNCRQQFTQLGAHHDGRNSESGGLCGVWRFDRR